MWADAVAIGSTLDYEDFLEICLTDLVEYVKHLRVLFQESVNLNLSSTANLALMVYQLSNSFSGGKADRKVTVQNFLPFKTDSSDKRVLKTSHKQTMDRLLKQRKLSLKLTNLVASAIR